MATRSPESTIEYLLTCLEETEGKTNWQGVAEKTGWYKSGKFASVSPKNRQITQLTHCSLQAFRGIEKKYKGTSVGVQEEDSVAVLKTPKKSPSKARATTPKKTPKKTPKRKGPPSDKTDDNDEDGEDEDSALKKAKVDTRKPEIKTEGHDEMV